MRLWMTRKLAEEHEKTRHTANHHDCVGFCAWGFSNVKHLDHSGNMGRAGRRKKNGWKKGWYKEFKRRLEKKSG